MRCHEARQLLASATEPSEEQLESLFGHVDACPSCQEFDESRLTPGPLVALASPTSGLYASVRAAARDSASLGDEANIDAMAVLEAADEPAPELLERAFARIDADAELSAALAPTPEPLRALRSELAPKLAGFSSRVSAALAPCFEARRALAGRAEPAPAAAELCFAHIDACERCQTEEAHPAFAAWSASIDRAELFRGFADGVMAKLPLRLGPRRAANIFSLRSTRVRTVLALAAALLVALTVWKLVDLEEAKQKPEGPSGPNLAVEGQSFGEQFSNLRGFKPGIEWQENSDERQDGVERFSNEATLPGRDVEYSLPRSAPRGAERAQPKAKPSLKQRLKREAKGPALSF